MAIRRARLDKLMDYWEPKIRDAFRRSFAEIRDSVRINQIADMLERGDVEAAVRALDMDPTMFRQFDRAVEQAFEAGGQFTASSMPTLYIAEGLRAKFQFDMRNPAAERWLSEWSGTRITEITSDQQMMIRETLTASLAEGRNPRSAALDLAGRIGRTGTRQGGMIGLTTSQSQWVRNYRAELLSDNPLKALERNLRDKRFDAQVKRAARLGTRLTAEQVDNMVTSYQNRAMRYRAEAIARTETMAALHEAQEQAVDQAVESGLISRDAVGFTWHTAQDDRVRELHEVMHGQTIGFGEMFTDGAGNSLRFPGDPDAPAETTINCRCWVEAGVDFLAGVE